jgi:putative membrane protein insertion efficiency factor
MGGAPSEIGDRGADEICVSAERRVTPVQRWMLRSIDAYQRAFHGRPSPCRFFPSCSEYGAEAIRLHGARRGLWLTIRRLARCRPLGPSGFDPVPLPHHHPEH